jgi:hypothetical protein
MMSSLAALAFRAYSEDAIRPLPSTVSSAHMGGPTTFTPWAASALSSARGGKLARRVGIVEEHRLLAELGLVLIQ